MENWLYCDFKILSQVIISVLLIFSIIIILTRISGLRSFAKMSSFDFASNIAIGSILAGIIMNGNQSILKGLVALTAILGFQAIFSYCKRNIKWFNGLATNEPIMLMKDGKVIKENLEASNVSMSDLYSKLREANVRDESEVLAVVFECTGDISVIHTQKVDTLSESILPGVKD